MVYKAATSALYSPELVIALRSIIKTKFQRDIDDADASKILTKLAQFVWAKYPKEVNYGG